MLEDFLFPGPLSLILTVLLGIVLLVSGRRLFWLTVAVLGFLTGLALTLLLLEIQPEWVGWLIALIAGLLGALLAIFLQRIAVVIAGFLAGGFLLVWLLQLLNVDGLEWLVYIIGGVIGALLAASLFDVALIGLSSLAGAALIVGVINLGEEARLIIFVLLIITGLVIQSSRLRRS